MWPDYLTLRILLSIWQKLRGKKIRPERSGFYWVNVRKDWLSRLTQHTYRNGRVAQDGRKGCCLHGAWGEVRLRSRVLTLGLLIGLSDLVLSCYQKCTKFLYPAGSVFLFLIWYELSTSTVFSHPQLLVLGPRKIKVGPPKLCCHPAYPSRHIWGFKISSLERGGSARMWLTPTHGALSITLGSVALENNGWYLLSTCCVPNLVLSCDRYCYIPRFIHKETEA